MKESGKLKKCILIIGLVLLIPWAILAILDTVDIDLSSLSGRFSIFNDIQGLEDALSPYVIDQVSDPAVESLNYTQAVQWVVERDGFRFTVFGYTFVDQETAQQYRSEFSGSARFFSKVSETLHVTAECITRYHTNVLYIKGEKRDSTRDFLNWLEPQLSIKLEGIMRASFEEFVMEEYGQYPDSYLENYDEYFKLDDLYCAHK